MKGRDYMDSKKYLSMTIDELADEISATKAKLSALNKLMAIRREMGEKTTKQIKAKERSTKKASERTIKDSESIMSSSAAY